MNNQALRFFDETGRDLNFRWDSDKNRWVGNVWFPETSINLFASKAIYVAEKYYDNTHDQVSFRYPISDSAIELNSVWQDDDSEPNIFQYRTRLIDSLLDRFIDVDAATTGNIDINVGIASADGYDLSQGDVILVKDQTNPIENGIYQVGTSYSLTRIELLDGHRILNNLVKVKYGVEQSLSIWKTTSTPNDIVGTDAIEFTRSIQNTVNSFYDDPEIIERLPNQSFDVDVDQVRQGTLSANIDGIYTGEINEVFDGPISIFLGFHGNKSDESEKTLLIQDVTNDSIIAEINCYGASIQEDIRFKNWLDNLGAHIQESDLKIFKDFDIDEAEIDYQKLNQKRKELIISWSDIYPYLGSYRALIFAARFFGYEDLKIKEYYRNINPESEFFNTYHHSEIMDSFDRNSNRSKLSNSSPSGFPNNAYRKTSVLGLFYPINDESTYEFDLNSENQPVLPYTYAEMVLKLFGLREKLEQYFMPLNSRIVDIVGEGFYIHNYQVIHSTKDTLYDNFKVGIRPDFNLDRISLNKFGNEIIRNNVHTIPCYLRFTSNYTQPHNINRIQRFKFYAQDQNSSNVIESNWQYDLNNINDFVLTTPGEYEILVDVQDWFNNTQSQSYGIMTIKQIHPAISIINNGDRTESLMKRPVDFGDMNYYIDFGTIFMHFYPSFDVIDIDAANQTILVDLEANNYITNNSSFRFSLLTNQTDYITGDLSITSWSTVTVNSTDYLEIVLADWDSIIQDEDELTVNAHILPNPVNIIGNADIDFEKYEIQKVYNQKDLVFDQNLSYEKLEYNLIDTANFLVDGGNPWPVSDYILEFIINDLVQNNTTRYRINGTFEDEWGNTYIIDKFIIQIK